MPSISTGTKVQNKPAAAGVASPVAIVLIWIAGQFAVEIPPEVAAAMTTLIVTLAYVFTPASKEA